MRLLADENVPLAVVRGLRERGHDVESIPPGTADQDIVDQASLQNRVLLTLDKDFANVLQHPPGPTKGVILLRIHPPVIDDMMSALGRVLDRPAKVFSGKLFVVDRKGVHVRD